MENTDYLLLKWGTLKGWNFSNSPQAFEALQKYNELGMSMGAMTQKDTSEQKKLICDMIDSVNGPITLDWTDEDVTNNKQKAKDYVLNYGCKKEAL